jgi:hypothetical protein
LTIVAFIIPIMASFNFFLSPSMKVSLKYTSFGYCGITTHNCSNMSQQFSIISCFPCFSSLKASTTYFSLHTIMNLEINARWTSPQVVVGFVVS